MANKEKYFPCTVVDRGLMTTSWISTTNTLGLGTLQGFFTVLIILLTTGDGWVQGLENATKSCPLMLVLSVL